MRFAITLAFTAALIGASPAAAQESAPNALTPEESGQGWRLLFDGKSLSGWEARTTSDPQTSPDWTVQAGSLLCGGTAPSWLGTVDSFGDYILRLEFRGPAGVNSGVFLRSDKEGAPHQTGYELQIWDHQPAGFNTGSLVGVVKASAAETLADVWNRYEVTADGDQIIAVLNGRKILDVHDPLHSSGVVGLQCQPDQRIEFRNIKLRPLR